MLIALAGLPGTGKTTIARLLAARLTAVHLRIDTLEQALLASGAVATIGIEGYVLSYALAADNLAVGNTVIADCVNGAGAARQAWRDVAARHTARFHLVEVRCSDTGLHRARVEGRQADIAGHALPTWASVMRTQSEPINGTASIVVDTAKLTADAAARWIIDRVR